MGNYGFRGFDDEWRVAESLKDCTRLSNGYSLQERTAQHYSVLSELQQLGYEKVLSFDELIIRQEAGNKLLEIPSLDFTAEELMKLRFLKHLYEKGHI